MMAAKTDGIDMKQNYVTVTLEDRSSGSTLRSYVRLSGTRNRPMCHCAGAASGTIIPSVYWAQWPWR